MVRARRLLAHGAPWAAVCLPLLKIAVVHLLVFPGDPRAAVRQLRARQGATG